MTTYAIRFDFPEGAVYAGMHKGGLGFAPTVATACLFDDSDQALNTLTNGYGPARKWGRVVTVATTPA